MSSQPAAPTDSRTAERRASVRHPVYQKCLVRPEGGRGGPDWQGIAYNLSTGGIGIALPCPLRTGTVLVIEPWNLPRARPLRVRVVRSHLLDFLWFHGCQMLQPIPEDDLDVWLSWAL